MSRFLRRLLLWSFICIISAVPSFLCAANQFNEWAMVTGVAVFIAFYTVLTNTNYFDRFHDLPFVRTTLYIGYAARLVVSIAVPIGVGADVLPGLVSINIVRGCGLIPESFEGTLATTIVQGTLLNIILVLFMLLVYGFQWIALKAPGEPVDTRRGFEVLPAATHPSELAGTAAAAGKR